MTGDFTDLDRDGRILQHDVILCQARVIQVLFVRDHGRHPHGVTLHHEFTVGREWDPDWDEQLFNRE